MVPHLPSIAGLGPIAQLGYVVIDLPAMIAGAAQDWDGTDRVRPLTL